MYVCIYIYIYTSYRLPRWLSVKESTCQCRRFWRHGFDPWVGRSPGVGNGNPFQYFCLGNPMDRGAWRATVHGVATSQTRLSDFTFIFTFMYWRRKWQPTPVFLPGESQGWGILVGCRLWGRTESDTTEAT